MLCCNLRWIGGAGFKPDPHCETGDCVAGSTTREALTGARLAIAAFSLITLLVISCSGADTPASTPESGSGAQPATSEAISGSQPSVVTVQSGTAVPLPTAAAAINETATPPAGGGPTPTPLPSPGMAGSGGGITMGGSALGGNADTVLLAQQVLQDLPAGDLVWAGYETRLEAGEGVHHTHEFAFVYAISGLHLVYQGMLRRGLEPNQGNVISANIGHQHAPLGGASTFLEVLLTAPGSDPPPNSADPRLVFGERHPSGYSQCASSYLCAGACASGRPDQRPYPPRAGNIFTSCRGE